MASWRGLGRGLTAAGRGLTGISGLMGEIAAREEEKGRYEEGLEMTRAGMTNQFFSTQEDAWGEGRPLQETLDQITTSMPHLKKNPEALKAFEEQVTSRHGAWQQQAIRGFSAETAEEIRNLKTEAEARTYMDALPSIYAERTGGAPTGPTLEVYDALAPAFEAGRPGLTAEGREVMRQAEEPGASSYRDAERMVQGTIRQIPIDKEATAMEELELELKLIGTQAYKDIKRAEALETAEAQITLQFYSEYVPVITATGIIVMRKKDVDDLATLPGNYMRNAGMRVSAWHLLEGEGGRIGSPLSEQDRAQIEVATGSQQREDALRNSWQVDLAANLHGQAAIILGRTLLATGTTLDPQVQKSMDEYIEVRTSALRAQWFSPGYIDPLTGQRANPQNYNDAASRQQATEEALIKFGILSPEGGAITGGDRLGQKEVSDAIVNAAHQLAAFVYGEYGMARTRLEGLGWSAEQAEEEAYHMLVQAFKRLDPRLRDALIDLDRRGKLNPQAPGVEDTEAGMQGYDDTDWRGAGPGLFGYEEDVLESRRIREHRVDEDDPKYRQIHR